MNPPDAPLLLIVDDDEGLVRLLQKALRREGFATATALSGKDAITWLQENRADLMLLDLQLNDIHANEFIKQVERLGRAIPFIIITGQGDERVAVEMMKRGALDYVVKDVQFIEFVPTVVRRALEKLDMDQRLAAAQAALEESKKQVLLVSEREQRRFGAELHDGLGQQLTAIELRCQSLLQDIPAPRKDLKKQAEQISQYLREAIAQTRALAHGLAPLSLDSRGLAEALTGLAWRMTKAGSIQVIFKEPTLVAPIDDLVAGHLFRIAQEAVNNAVKHAQATRIDIHLNDADGILRLEISDNGHGFQEAQKKGGIGLEIMRHRASVIGAGLSIESQPGAGVKVVCALPVNS
ncbi:MAG: response regulator [Verrucomicrobiales bacterium]